MSRKNAGGAKVSYDYSAFADPIVVSKKKHWFGFAEGLGDRRDAQKRIAQLAEGMERRLDAIRVTAPSIDGKSTNPFVLAAFSRVKRFKAVAELDALLAAAKEFSSLETALGRVVEDVVPKVYGWEKVETPSHSPLSEIDSAKVVGNAVRLVALKSGPACVNDTMVAKIGEAIAAHCLTWADHWGVKHVEFTVGMNYSTAKNSNKKDWHAIRLAELKLTEAGADIKTSCIIPPRVGRTSPTARNHFIAKVGDVDLRVFTRQGVALWDYIASPVEDAYLEVCAALAITASRNPELSPAGVRTTTGNLADVIKLPGGANACGGTFLTPAQLQWFFLFARHFVDGVFE